MTYVALGAAEHSTTMSTYYAPGPGSAAARSLAAGAQAMGGAAEHVPGSGPATAPSLAAGALTMGGVAEHVLLAPEELPQLRRRGQPRSQSLHDEARAWTNRFASGASEHVGVQADLAVEWENWKEYIATRKNAEQLVGLGVVAFTAELIEGTRDANRRGARRLDLVLRHSDGQYVRLHPGPRPKSDAIPRFFPPTAPEHGAHPSSAPEHAAHSSSAPEHAAHEWRTPGADWTFSPERAALVPQGDRLGKEAVWRTVERLMTEGLVSGESQNASAMLNITDGSTLRWWLWICNLGNLTWEVIGVGVHSARLALNGCDEAVFTFSRADDTECTVRLQCIRRGKGRALRVYI